MWNYKFIVIFITKENKVDILKGSIALLIWNHKKTFNWILRYMAEHNVFVNKNLVFQESVKKDNDLEQVI